MVVGSVVADAVVIVVLGVFVISSVIVEFVGGNVEVRSQLQEIGQVTDVLFAEVVVGIIVGIVVGVIVMGVIVEVETVFVVSETAATSGVVELDNTEVVALCTHEHETGQVARATFVKDFAVSDAAVEVVVS